MSRRRKTAVGLVLFCLAVVFLLYRAINPPDRIKVKVTNIPPDTRFVSLVAESRGKLQNMDWSPELLAPFRMHPAECSWSSAAHPAPDGTLTIDWDAYVHWRWGQRYGIVTRSKAGIWRVTWFKPEEVAVHERHPIKGGGFAEFDGAKGTAVPLTSEDVERLGLQGIGNEE